MTEVNSQEDLLKLLEQNPDWHAAVLEQLTEPVLIPHGADIAAFMDAVNRYTEVMTTFASQQAVVNQALLDRTDRTNTDLSLMAAQMQTTLNHIYDERVRRHLDFIASRNLDVNSATVTLMADEERITLVETSLTVGQITQDQAHNLLQTDLIFSGYRRHNTERTYFPTQISLNPTSQDLQRASQSADALELTIRKNVRPTVICQSIENKEAADALLLNVTVITFP